MSVQAMRAASPVSTLLRALKRLSRKKGSANRSRGRSRAQGGGAHGFSKRTDSSVSVPVSVSAEGGGGTRRARCASFAGKTGGGHDTAASAVSAVSGEGRRVSTSAPSTRSADGVAQAGHGRPRMGEGVAEKTDGDHSTAASAVPSLSAEGASDSPSALSCRIVARDEDAATVTGEDNENVVSLAPSLSEKSASVSTSAMPSILANNAASSDDTQPCKGDTDSVDDSRSDGMDDSAGEKDDDDGKVREPGIQSQTASQGVLVASDVSWSPSTDQEARTSWSCSMPAPSIAEKEQSVKGAQCSASVSDCSTVASGTAFNSDMQRDAEEPENENCIAHNDSESSGHDVNVSAIAANVDAIMGSLNFRKNREASNLRKLKKDISAGESGNDKTASGVPCRTASFKRELSHLDPERIGSSRRFRRVTRQWNQVHALESSELLE